MPKMCRPMPVNRCRRHCSSVVVCLVLVALAPVAASAQPSFTKSFEPATIGPGSTSTLTFEINNTSSAGVRNLAFNDTLPSGVTIASPANASSSCFGTLAAPSGGGTISLFGGQVGGSSSCSVTVDVTSSTPGVHTNISGDLTSDAGNSGSATADLTVATDRPGFTKSFSPASVAFGGRTRLTFTFDNSANASAAERLTFTDNLPVGMTVAGPANASTTCTGGVIDATAGASVIGYAPGPPFFNDASVAAGSTCTLGVDVIGGSVGVLGNTSGDLTSQTGFGAPLSSGKASANLTVSVERLSLTKSFTDDPTLPGDTVTLEFTLRNLDRRSSASGITFTDDLDATLSGLVATGLPLTNPCGVGSALTGTSLITLTGGNLAAEASCTFSVVLQVPAGAAPGSYVNTTSVVSGDSGGQPISGQPASDTLAVSAAPLLTKSFSPNPTGAASAVSLDFSITNTSSTQAATDIAFSDNLSAFSTGVSVTSLPAGGFCGAGSTLISTFVSGNLTLVMSGGNLAASDFCSFSVGLQLGAGESGLLTNTTSTITATINGQTEVGRAASAQLEVVEAPTLLKQFTDDPVAPGDTVTLEFTLSLSEESTSGAAGITFTDDLAAALSGLTAVNVPQNDICGAGSSLTGSGSPANSLLTFAGGSLPAGGSCTISVTLQVPASALPGSFTNTTSNVMASSGGVDTVGDPGEDALQISGLTFTKEFTDDPVIAGGTVTLQFTIDNTASSFDATGIFFTDNLSAVVSGLASTSGTQNDICGTGSQLSGTTGLTFSGGNLLAGQSCTFSATLLVPAATDSGTFPNVTSNLSAQVDSTTLFLDPAVDGLTVSSELLLFTKEFTDDPVAPGGTVNLEFTLTNLSATDTVTGIAFTDDLEAALSGLASTSGTLNDVCGTGSQISGVGLLSFTGGSLAPGASCTFSVSVSVPADVAVGTVASNVTSEATGSVGGLAVTGDPAIDDLQIDSLIFTKAFAGPVVAGDTVVLTFSIENPSTTEGAGGLGFTDNLDAALAGLTAIGLPLSDVCGVGSLLEGTSFLTLASGSLLPGGTCTFAVTVQVPAGAEPGSYVNITSELLLNGLRAAGPAIATLEVIDAPVDDQDGDGVLDVDDFCPDTVIPEGVPTRRLGRNRYALVDGDGIFDTNPPGNPPTFTIFDTGGCSCEQIIVQLGLGRGHEFFGCSRGAMQDWVDIVNPPPDDDDDDGDDDDEGEDDDDDGDDDDDDGGDDDDDDDGGDDDDDDGGDDDDE